MTMSMPWCAALAAALSAVPARAADVKLVRVPDGGIQPQAVRDRQGTLHLIYFAGDPAAGDLLYVRQRSSAPSFSAPLRVNSTRSSAVALGSIRGGQLALGKNGRVHVAWNGSSSATPAGPRGETPMLYARLNDAGDAFELQRNVIGAAYGLDGGGSVAADEAGNVLVFWHAMAGAKDEAGRRVFAVRSTDSGLTFRKEEQADPNPTGACGCCGMKAWLDGAGTAYVMYRTAANNVDRDMALLVGDVGGPYRRRVFAPWPVATCPMSSAFLAGGPQGAFAAWERQGQVYFANIDPQDGAFGKAVFPKSADGAGTRKHPTLAVAADGRVLFAWTEGTGWNRGGQAAWQEYGTDGKPRGEIGRAAGVPAWSFGATVADRDGGFTLLR